MAGQDGILATFPSLQQDLICDVAIIGAGITGALIAHVLMQEGLDLIVLDKRDVAWGSTSASTALLQYEIDTELHELKKLVGPAPAERAYRLGTDAITWIEEIAGTLDESVGFRRTPSLYVARQKRGFKNLQEEYDARRALGLAVELVDEQLLCREFDVQAHAAILSSTAATMDPYRFTHALLTRAQQHSARVFDRTEVTGFEHVAQGVRLTTNTGHNITAAKIVFATGYESEQYLRHKTSDLHSTFALVSEPVDPEIVQRLRYVLWETARPYFYLRTTQDNRIIVGGGDEPFRSPLARDRLIGRKTKKLVKQFSELYPALPPLEVAFSWAGTFGVTKDGLAYIGTTGDFPNAYFALGYGGNGITYSMIAARIIADLLMGRANPDAEIFRFGR